jgi:hypothetical protein
METSEQPAVVEGGVEVARDEVDGVVGPVHLSTVAEEQGEALLVLLLRRSVG